MTIVRIVWVAPSDRRQGKREPIREEILRKENAMAFKTAFIIMAPGGDPTKDRALIKTPKLELTSVVVGQMNFDQAVAVCKEMAEEEGVRSFTLCPGFTHGAIARIQDAVGENVAISVARGDAPGGKIVGGILKKEGWLEGR